MLELGDFHRTVQHIGNILPVVVMKFYLYVFDGHMFLQSCKTSTWPPMGKITVVRTLPLSVETITMLCTYTVLLQTEHRCGDRKM